MTLDRENIQKRLHAMDDCIVAIDEQMRTLTQPLRIARDSALLVREMILEDAGLEEHGSCEGCSKILFVGDKAHVCSDGPTLCEDCAPSYGDCRRQAVERQGEGDTEAEEAIAAIDARTAAGGSLEDKAVHPL